MQAFTILEGLVAPLDRANVDTDAIIPKQFLKSISRSGFGPFLFDDWRYLDRGSVGQDCGTRPKNPDFVLNQPRYQGAQILLARENFGCGSSREHAAWALADYGFRAVIATSFADIFHSNCGKNGLPAITLDAADMDRLFAAVGSAPGYRLQIDLPAQRITTSDGETLRFEIDPHRKHCLLEGLDGIAMTLRQADQIRAYEASRRLQEPWLFASH